ncbi:MAG: hypothetical protein WAW92_04465, partial [Minisyncoccia bacterium]
MNGGDKKRILAVLIVCVGGIVSAWLLSSANNPSKTAESGVNNLDAVIAYVSTTSIDNNQDWYSTVVKTTQKYTDLTASNSTTTDDTTLTSQLTIEIMSRYLALKAGGREVSQNEIDQIISDVTSDPRYTKTLSPVYVVSNLKVINKNDFATVKQYKDKVNASIKKLLSQVKDDPGT